MSGYQPFDSRGAAKAPGTPYSKTWFNAALLLLCAIPFGWLGIMAPVIWLSLCAIENTSGWKRVLVYVAAALAMLIAAMGVLPGAERIELIPPFTDADGNNIQAAFNPGKAVIAIALLAFLARPRYWPRRGDLPYIAVAILLPLACAAVYAGFSPKFSATIVLAALINLLVVCISEEGFFRWVLQRGLEEALGRWRWLAVLTVTAIFTYLHTGWAASPAALTLVGLAGLCYALLWHLRGNFWAGVLAHWGVNLLHLFFLPYPLPA